MDGKEKILCVSEALDMRMDGARAAALEPTYTDWMRRAKRLDEKMAGLSLDAPAAANVFVH